jgi:hypothetical protein
MLSLSDLAESIEAFAHVPTGHGVLDGRALVLEPANSREPVLGASVVRITLSLSSRSSTRLALVTCPLGAATVWRESRRRLLDTGRVARRLPAVGPGFLDHDLPILIWRRRDFIGDQARKAKGAPIISPL